ncbi:hypothetical protein ACOT81_03475 [Streptomyces sp. WI04-05B]|uniref:hypothetical protein n=1 Tax=Streptomyces TaxID=1883 RepID=UPI0039F49A61
MTGPRPGNALGLLAGPGYDGVGLKLGHPHLDPHAPELAARCYFRELGDVPLGRRHIGSAAGGKVWAPRSGRSVHGAVRPPRQGPRQPQRPPARSTTRIAV